MSPCCDENDCETRDACYPNCGTMGTGSGGAGCVLGECGLHQHLVVADNFRLSGGMPGSEGVLDCVKSVTTEDWRPGGEYLR
jgi:hypothetical protein